ncbi:MAG: DUF4340 domain-containing protein, partial [Opitutaceae bacterium]
MRTKATLFLLVLVLGLGAVAYYFNRQWDAQRNAIASRTHVLGPDAVDLDYLRIDFQDNPIKIELEKKASGWELLEPVQWPANFFAVSRLVSELQTLERESSFEADGASLADYGLAEPQGTLTHGRRDERGVLKIGNQTDVGGRLYVLPDDSERIFVVSDTLLRSLQQSVEDFRSDAVFTISPTEVRSWNIQIAESGNLRVWLSRDGEKWKLETPVQARADKAAVETLINHILTNLEVERFETGLTDLNLIRLATPDYIVAFEGAGRREALLIGSRVPGQPAEGKLHFAKLENNPTIVVIEGDFLEDLKTAQLRLRERKLLEFDPERLQTISISPGGRATPIELQRLENGQWQVVSRYSADAAPVTMPGDAVRISALIEELQNLRALPPPEGFVTDAPTADDLANKYYLANPSWTLTLVERPEEPSGMPAQQTLLLGGVDYDRVFAQVGDTRNAARSVYRVDRGLADDLSSEPRHYRERQIQNLTEGARITAVSIRRLIAETPEIAVELASPEQTWDEALASLPAQQRENIHALIDRLRDLRAREIVATEFSTTVPNEPGEQPWTWILEATINLEGGSGQKRTFRLYLDDYAGGPDLLAATP